MVGQVLANPQEHERCEFTSADQGQSISESQPSGCRTDKSCTAAGIITESDPSRATTPTAKLMPRAVCLKTRSARTNDSSTHVDAAHVSVLRETAIEVISFTATVPTQLKHNSQM